MIINFLKCFNKKINFEMINQWVFAVSIEHLDFVNRTCSIQVYSQAYCSGIIPCEKRLN